MSALYRPRRLRDPHVVPTESVEVDWSHPLAARLVALYIPDGAYGFADTTGIGIPLTAGTGATFGTSSFGPGIASTVSGGRLFTTTLPAQLQLATGGSLVWCGGMSGTPTDNVMFLGTTQNASASAPYVCYDLGFQSGDVAFFYNSAGTFSGNACSFAAGTTSQWRSLAATFATNGGPINLFGNGALQASATWSGGAPTYTATSALVMGGDNNDPTRNIAGITSAGMIFDAALSADQVAWLAAEPFAMLRPRG